MDNSIVVDELIDGMAKPQGSLGLLEKHARRVLNSWGGMSDFKPCHVVFASDNGVVDEGVATFPPVITYLQAKNMVEGRATINSFCRAYDIPCVVVDVGVNSPDAVGLDYKIARGSKNFVREPAMSEAEYAAIHKAAGEVVTDLTGKGYTLFSFGEMGIGNTTTSSAVLHALTGIEPEFVVGYGASQPNSEVIIRKRNAIVKGMELNRASLNTTQDIIRCLGGFDIVGMCAAMQKCAELGLPFVIDGFISAVSFACACRINDAVKQYAIPSHLSKEPGMVYALLLGGILVDEVPIRGNLALGEGTGAVLMVGLLKAMLGAVKNMARMSDFDLSDAAIKTSV
ncbi:MAG: Nicotinate-nucleotide--dimethylbenzimidazole phosphoribosyltransferase [Firmicutes bacterium]|nr:Nicotinate-nucleotide--dimethylbenzimidazole phosphoribosyltransferase [Bacillota bacterium]